MSTVQEEEKEEDEEEEEEIEEEEEMVEESLRPARWSTHEKHRSHAKPQALESYAAVATRELRFHRRTTTGKPH
jgi:hypothetical protein